MMSDEATAAANAAFNRLADTLIGRSMGDRPIEDVAREMLRGMLKQWLDENLPALVEHLVREEIERVARRGR
jgi:cell pole-organizing protein PopZ